MKLHNGAWATCFFYWWTSLRVVTCQPSIPLLVWHIQAPCTLPVSLMRSVSVILEYLCSGWTVTCWDSGNPTAIRPTAWPADEESLLKTVARELFLRHLGGRSKLRHIIQHITHSTCFLIKLVAATVVTPTIHVLLLMLIIRKVMSEWCTRSWYHPDLSLTLLWER